MRQARSADAPNGRCCVRPTALTQPTGLKVAIGGADIERYRQTLRDIRRQRTGLPLGAPFALAALLRATCPG